MHKHKNKYKFKFISLIKKGKIVTHLIKGVHILDPFNISHIKLNK